MLCSARFIRITVSLVGMLLLGSLFATAQPLPSCPPKIIDSTACDSMYQVNWTNGGCITDSITVGIRKCPYEICFCYRENCIGAEPYYEFFITRVTILDTNCTDTITTTFLRDLLTNIGKRLVERNDPHWDCPTCPTTWNYWRVYFADCTKITVFQGTKVITPCGYNKVCWRRYSSCCDPISGYPIVTQIGSGSSGSGGCILPGCNAICD